MFKNSKNVNLHVFYRKKKSTEKKDKSKCNA